MRMELENRKNGRMEGWKAETNGLSFARNIPAATRSVL